MNVLGIPQAREIAGTLAGKILNVLVMCWVGTCMVLCPFPCNVLVMYWPGIQALAPSVCLAWWDRAYGRHLEEQKTHRAEAEATGAAGSFADLPDHDAEWLKIVNDVAFVMQKAQGSQVLGRGMSGPSNGTKRKHEVEPPTTRKRPTGSRTRSRA